MEKKVIHYHLTKIIHIHFFLISETETRERDVATEDRVVRSEQRDERPRRKVETR